MYEVAITEEDLVKARGRYDFINLNNSITNGASQLYGAIGEVMILKFYKNRLSSLTEDQFNSLIVDKSSYDWDLIINDKTIEVKTKKINFPPREEYIVSVACSNASQKCDYYYFAMVHDDCTKGWLLGFMRRKDFFNKATLCKKGEVDPLSKDNNYIVKADCYSLRISDITTRIK